MGNQSKQKIEAIVRYTLDRMLADSALRLFITKLCFDYYEDSKSDDTGAYLESLKSKLKDKVYVYTEKMVITFHFTDDKQELSYEDT